ncbi:MAG: glycosyltransferase family 4 protein [Chitinophagaceae bacterium]|nr:glycosyltransferase family 4 protein [Chitinophagaceae bacterium]
MNKQTIIHIANDYTGSMVYKNLITELDQLKTEQIIYTPIKTNANIGKNEVHLSTNGSKIIYSNILNKSIDRIFYKHKIKKIIKDIESKIDFSRVKLIHAHTWYSDGGVAYLLSKKYNIPYIVTVRNSDLNVFYKYLIHKRRFGRKILENANKIILIAATYKARTLSLSSLQSVKKEIERKMLIIPNGVDSFWIDHTRKIQTDGIPASKDIYNLLFIGKFSKGKNIIALQKAIIQMQREDRFNVILHIVGGDGDRKKLAIRQIKSFPNLFKYYGKVYDKQQLLQVFRSCDIFTMPSRHETFGLVYVEAMLQGLPILYTQHEGIDGFYEEKIGEKVQNFSTEEIKQKLYALIINLNNYIIPTNKIKQNHNWTSIAKIYLSLYENSV